MIKLTQKQDHIYKALVDYYDETGETPYLSDFARDQGISYMSLKQHLEALQKKGFVAFTSVGTGKRPKLRLIHHNQSPKTEKPSQTQGIPLLGSISAGMMELPDLEANSYLDLAGYDQDYFALKVKGDSMAPTVHNDDIVILKKSNDEWQNKICAVSVEATDVTLKWVIPFQDSVLLKPDNPNYPIVEQPSTSITIVGVFEGLIRGSIAKNLIKHN